MVVTLRNIEEARSNISPYVRRTPTVRFLPLRDDLPYSIWLKCENLQVTGSFKARGAVNRILSLTSEEISRGIITASGGNHGLGVAYAARLRSVSPTVFVPQKADESRRERLRRWGARVIAEGRDWDDAFSAALEESRRSGAVVIHPFEDPWVIAGQGTAMEEFLEDCPVRLDAVIAGIGGGGLISGVATSAKGRSPDLRVIGVEPVGAASMTASLRAGSLVELPSLMTIADTLSARKVGAATLDTCARLVDNVVLVEDQSIIRAMNVLWNESNLLVEPSAAAPLAALLSGVSGVAEGSTVGLVLSGGNIDARQVLDRYR